MGTQSMDRRAILAGLALGGAGLATKARAQSSVDASRAMAEKFAATLSAHDMTAFAALFAEDYRNHQVSAATPPPPAGKSMKQGSVDFFAARVAGAAGSGGPRSRPWLQRPTGSRPAFVYTGTHRGLYFGVAPTGRSLRFTSCDIFTIRRRSIRGALGDG